MHEWSPETDVDAPLARLLIAAQFPELELASLRLLAAGWDNTVWVVDDRWAFRFPRREIAIPGVERELAVLPQLARLLPLPVPDPVFVGRPTDAYPWPFFGAALLPGREAADAALTDDERNLLARPLAAFLRTLHGLDARVGAELPADPIGRTDMARRAPWAGERLAELERLGLWRTPSFVATLLDEARALPPVEPTAIVHGDLHFRHLLVGDDGSPTGVIDWGDVCRSDPSVDLQLGWSFFPVEGRAAFFDEYGPVTDAQLLRARVLALFLCATLALYGHHEGMTAVEREALGGLARAASG